MRFRLTTVIPVSGDSRIVILMRDGEKLRRDLLLSALKSDQSVRDLNGQLAEPSNVDRSGRLRRVVACFVDIESAIHLNALQTKRNRVNRRKREKHE